MPITGNMLIGASSVRGTLGTLRAIDAVTRADLEPEFGLGGSAEVDRAASLAQAAFDTYRATTPEARAAFLEAIAQNILDLGDELINRAHQESALPIARLQG